MVVALRKGNAKRNTAGSQHSQVRRIGASRYADGAAATLMTMQSAECSHRSHTFELLPASLPRKAGWAKHKNIATS